MSFQLPVPKNAGAYFLYFITFIVIFGGMLYFYLLGPELFGENRWFAVLFDLTSPKCLFRWFISMVWLITALGSFLMLIFAVLQKQGITKSLFWLSTAAVSFFLSADTVCSYTPFVRHLLEQTVVQYAGNDGAGVLTSWIIAVAGITFLITEINLLYRYLKSMEHRVLLNIFFVPAVICLILSLGANYSIPSGTAPESAGINQTEEINQTARSVETEPQEKAEPEAESPSKPGADEKDFRQVAFAKTGKSDTDENASADEPSSEKSPATPAVITRWEDLFGIEEVEKRWNLETSWEKTLGCHQTLEEILFDGTLEWDTVRTRELVREGLYGLFVLFFSMGLGLLGRAERVLFDEKQEKLLEMLKVQFLDNFNR